MVTENATNDKFLVSHSHTRGWPKGGVAKVIKRTSLTWGDSNALIVCVRKLESKPKSIVNALILQKWNIRMASHNHPIRNS